jgi:antitoxin component YwqK of YwqJK toxin-antitoxin module
MIASSRKHTVVLAVLVMAGALAALLISRHRHVPSPAPEREAAIKELTRREGRMFFGAEAEPFTGVMIERYPSGELKARSKLARGVLEGVSEGWHTNGVLQVRELFHEGVSHGVRTKWFPDGNKLSEATIENGKITGTFRRWHVNGALAEEIQMTNNQPDGLSRIYYPSGALRAEARIEKGKVLEQHSWKDGENQKLAAAPAPH